MIRLQKLLSTTAIASFVALGFAGPSSANSSLLDKHVLLISIDGFHAADLEYCVAHKTCDHLAALAATGVTYTNAQTTKPTDSFPGMIAQVSGATPKTAGVFYDDSYDRTLYAPNCASGPGAEVTYAENVDTDLTRIDGGVAGSLSTLNAAIAISAGNLPGKLVDGKCQPVWPHNFVRVNTIFGVLHARGYRTAWADKHPAYDILNGYEPSAPNGPGRYIDDFFAPEINSDLSVANLQLLTTAGLKSTAPAPTPIPGGDFTKSIEGVEFYDGLKVQAVLNEINGLDHTGTKTLGVPAIFGMNFQSVSVGQKLKPNGYADPAATPTAGLQNAISFVDASIGKFIGELKKTGLYDKTAIIVSAKHGQSPIDKSKITKYNDGTVIAGPVGANLGFEMADDTALIWLKDNSGSKAADAIAALEAYGDTGIGEWLSGPLLTANYADPKTDSRTPDIIGVAKVGTIYTGSGSKIAEHGGNNEDDVHVALVVWNYGLRHARINAPVATAQIAPTILSYFDIEATELQGVKAEGTPVLPGLPFDRRPVDK